jgi:hypothetical protein
VNTIATDLTPDEAMQSLQTLAELLGTWTPLDDPGIAGSDPQVAPTLAKILESQSASEVRNFAGVLVSVPFQAQRKDIQAAVNYLLAQLAVRDQADQGGT